MTAWPPVRLPGEGALAYRLRYEEEATRQECGAIGCTNAATHTWSGHPTCDDCGLPGRKPYPEGYRLLFTPEDFEEAR